MLNGGFDVGALVQPRVTDMDVHAYLSGKSRPLLPQSFVGENCAPISTDVKQHLAVVFAALECCAESTHSHFGKSGLHRDGCNLLITKADAGIASGKTKPPYYGRLAAARCSELSDTLP